VSRTPAACETQAALGSFFVLSGGSDDPALRRSDTLGGC
jgi:hypothetical protein